MDIEHKKLKTLPIHYYVTGNKNAPCIIFLHPAFADHRVFDRQLAYFSKDYRVITIDLIGHGQSQNIKGRQGIDSTCRHIKEIMDIENLESIHLAGVSVGSLVAQDFANRYPQKVRSLCAVGGYDINHYDKAIEKQQRAQQLSFMLNALFSIDRFSKANARITAKTAAAQQEFYKMNRLFRRRSFRYMASLNTIMNQYQTQRNHPLLILCGDSDAPLSIQLSKKWNADEPDSMFSIIKDAGHCANMDNADAFNAALDKFLKKAL